MRTAVIEQMDALGEKRKQQIRASAEALSIEGRTYYVSNSGSDANDGLTPETAWQTLERVSTAELKPGDGVLFRRGDLFRGMVQTKPGVSYGAFGIGPKPKFYGWDENLADPALWERTGEHIWKYTKKILDPGTLVFEDDAFCSRKLIPSYIGGIFVCRDDERKPFRMEEEMTEDLDLYWHFDAILTREPSRGQDFPIPQMGTESYGDLYLRCDRGNPGSVFGSIEALPRRAMFRVGRNDHVHIDNLCMKYIGLHAVTAVGHVVGLHVTNCEIGWIGGTIQHYYGTDPNYPQGGRGTVTRFGNGVEVYGGCEDYVVSGCYVYQVYDAGITHQVTTEGQKYVMKDIRYTDNLVEHCVYAIEYFMNMTDGDTQSYMEDVKFSGNILRLSGYGWGQQRHNTDTPAHIKGWSYINKARDFRICGNVMDRSAYRMVHLVAQEAESCPEMVNNTYVQTLGGMLGQYGANKAAEPAILPYDLNVEKTIQTIFREKDPKIFFAE